MYCIGCGTQLPADASFCFRCGTQQQSAPAAPTPPSSPRVELRDITLVAVSCPVCGGPIKEESRCGFCGAVVVITMDMPRIDPASLKRAVIDQHIAEYRTAVRRDHHDGLAHYGLGIAYYNLRLYDEAIVEIEEAVRLMPENPNIQYQLAVMNSERMTPRAFSQEFDEHGRETLKRVNRALLLQPDLVEALLLKAALYSHPRYCQMESLTSTTSAEELVQAAQLWELALQAKPDSIRGPVAEFLRQPSIVRKDTPEIALGEAILRAAPQFKIKRGVFGTGNRQISDVEHELWQFYHGEINDPARLLGAAKYVIDVMRFRRYPAATSRPA